MSYDMQMAEYPGPDIPGYSPPLAGHTGLFMFSNSAMVDMLETMELAGVIDTLAMASNFPAWPPKGIPQKRIDALGAVFCVDGAKGNIGHDCVDEPYAVHKPHIAFRATRCAGSVSFRARR